ncbi:Type IV leader peptidase family protein [Anatilimnocola aggregata]|uniref:Type IV leader peptidase family protein n=1 Tax=Anatilimnocola aggregata TaxID=2528021 RepID=A0A517YLF0_9BACT|nr:A24 family peptidase [Anatilimnocola aggregata]QDU31030.1 Type IV leader peptidase family protein [Anatilimnocola aggregata]
MIVGYDYVALVAGFVTAAAVTDYRTRKIPNWLTVPAAILGLAYHSFAPGGFGPLTALAGFAVGFVLLLLPWILGGGGMGDVKLLAALGAWLGPLYILVAFALGTCFASTMAMALMLSSVITSGVSATQRQYLTAGASGGTSTGPGKAKKPKRFLPFVIPVAMGTWLVLAWMLLRSQTH